MERLRSLYTSLEAASFRRKVKNLHQTIFKTPDPTRPSAEEQAKIDAAAITVFGEDTVSRSDIDYEWNLILIAHTVRPDLRLVDDEGIPMRPQDEIDMYRDVQYGLVSELTAIKNRRQIRIVR